jgi:hypothetical protein
MPYTILKSDGTPVATISDGTTNTIATNLSLPGPNFVGYGQALNENLVYLLENFASNSTPAGNNLQGQLWFDKSNQILNVFTQVGFSPVSGITTGTTPPVVQKDGDIFFNKNTNQLYISSAGSFDLVGPLYTKLQGTSGAIPATVNDSVTIGLTHNIIQLQFGNVVIATVSTDAPFIPTPGIPGFSYINPGITLNNTLASTAFNSNVVGNLTGSVTGNLTGNVVATTLTGALTGNVTGNLTGNVVATTLTGALTGDVTSTNGHITNLTTSNAQITAGNVTGITNLSATNSVLTNVTAGTMYSTNLSVANLVVAGGSIGGLASLAVTNLSATNFNSGNVTLTGGTLSGMSTISATLATLNNITTGNIQATGGSLVSLGSISVLTAQATNFSSGNAQITGGAVTGLTNLASANATIANIALANAQVTGGNISNTVGVNNTLTNANLVNSTATTKSITDSSTAVATTAFVQGVLPRGAIIMWGGSLISIPSGWQLCDGSNSTPDLRDRFIVGAGLSYPVANVGGTNGITLTTSNLPPHTHLASLSGSTDQGGVHGHSIVDPGHIHPINVTQGGLGGQDGPTRALAGNQNTSSAVTGITIAQSTSHSHTLTITGNVGSTGFGTQIENRPLFYALCYIQKMF